MADRWLPRATPETQDFWDGTQVGELRLQRCGGCGECRLPPQPFCAACGSDDTEVFLASGRARLYSYVISHFPMPGFQPPYVIGVVELDEGPRLVSNLVDVAAEPGALPIDLRLEVVFEPVSDDVTLPLFRPAETRT